MISLLQIKLHSPLQAILIKHSWMARWRQLGVTGQLRWAIVILCTMFPVFLGFPSRRNHETNSNSLTCLILSPRKFS